jgi:hypothetical protein
MLPFGIVVHRCRLCVVSLFLDITSSEAPGGDFLYLELPK